MGPSGSIRKRETAAVKLCVNSLNTLDYFAMFVALNQWELVNSHPLTVHLKIE